MFSRRFALFKFDRSITSNIVFLSRRAFEFPHSSFVFSSGFSSLCSASVQAVLIKELNPELNTKEERGNSNALRERKTIFDVIDLSSLNEANLVENTKIEISSH